MNENDSPGARKLESQTPVSDVLVCVVCPLFVQHTVPPTGMVMFAGLKKLSPIEISVESVGQAGGGPPRSSFSTLESEVDCPSRPPAATRVLPTPAVPGNERCAFSGGCAVHAFVPGSKLTTSVVVNGVNGFPPPIAQSWCCATAPPATFLGVGRLARCVQLSVAMS